MHAQLHGVRVLVTTEKDVMNFPDNALDLLADIDVHWLKIGTVVHQEQELLKLISSGVNAPSATLEW